MNIFLLYGMLGCIPIVVTNNGTLKLILFALQLVSGLLGILVWEHQIT